MDLLIVSDILQFAIRIEENGIKFYGDYGEKFEDDEVKKLFDFMSREEGKHKEVFEKIFAEIKKTGPPGNYTDEYAAYMRAYADNVIFSQERLGDIVPEIKSVSDAVNFALQREMESILYYQETKGLLPQDQQDKVDLIIEEERRHSY